MNLVRLPHISSEDVDGKVLFTTSVTGVSMTANNYVGFANGTATLKNHAALTFTETSTISVALNASGYSSTIQNVLVVNDAVQPFVNVIFAESMRPAMTANPLVVDGNAALAAYAATYVATPPQFTSPIFPAGDIYLINEPARDVTLKNVTSDRPIAIYARNAWVVGCDIQLADLAAGAPGQCANQDVNGAEVSDASIYKRPTLGRALSVEALLTSLIEGTNIDCLGHNCDAVTFTSPAGVTASSDRANKKLYIINSHFRGWRGHPANYSGGGPGGGQLGDATHADSFQMQSEQQSYAELVVENCMFGSGQESMVANCVGVQPGKFASRNVINYIDSRYIDSNPDYRGYIAPIGCNAEVINVQTTWCYWSQFGGTLAGANGNDWLHWFGSSPMYFTVNGTGYGNAGVTGVSDPVPSGTDFDTVGFTPQPAPNYVVNHAGLLRLSGSIAENNQSHPSSAAGNDYAPVDRVGSNYAGAS